MYTLTAFFDSHFTGSHQLRLRYPFASLFLVLIMLVATPLKVQSAATDVLDRVNELHTVAPTIEDPMYQDEGRWSLNRGVSKSVFFAADSLHVRSYTTNKDEPYLMMTQSDLSADALFVEIEAQHVRGSLFNGFGFYLMQTPADYTFFYISNNGYAAIQHAALNSQEMLVPWQESSAIRTGNHAINQLGLLIEDDHATLFANGSEVASINEWSLEGATLGLVATSYEKSIVEIAFRDLHYWNLDELSEAPSAAQLAAASFTLDDLPDGFDTLPEEEVRTLLEDSFIEIFADDDSFNIINRFGFFDPNNYNFVIGATGSIVTSIDGLFTYMTTMVKRDETVELVELDQVGDESVAFGIRVIEGEEPAHMEFLLFRRDQVIGQLIIGYPDGTEPVVELKELAELWDARLTELSEGNPAKGVETDYLADGKALLERGEWQQALESLTQAIMAESENAEAYYYRGLAHYQLGTEDPEHYAMAIEDLTLAMENEEFFARANAIRNKINQAADAELLLATYSEQIEKSEHLATAYAGRGIVYRDQLGDYEKAIADLTQAIDLATEYQRGDYYIERAFAHMENGNTEAAIEDATQAIEDEYTTDICSAYAYRGGEYAELGQYTEAEVDLKRARTNCGDDAATLAFVSHQLGIVRYHRGKLEDALSFFSDAIERQAEAARGAARESWESDFASEPEENFEEIITYFETLIAKHQLQVWREGKLESEYMEYLTVFNAYDEMYAGAARTYGWLGGIYQEQTEYDRAIDAFTIAIELSPTDTALPNWYVRRGLLFYDQGDFDAARDDLTVAITLGRPDASEMAIAYNLLGLIASEEGAHREALAHYNMAISITPDDAIFYYNRALTFYDLDEYESAIADFEMVLELSEDADLREEAEEWISTLK